MKKMIGDYLSSIELGDVQEYKNMAVFPLFTSLNHSPEYLKLKEALDNGLLAITEICEGGRFPNSRQSTRGISPSSFWMEKSCRGKAEQGSQHHDPFEGCL